MCYSSCCEAQTLNRRNACRHVQPAFICQPTPGCIFAVRTCPHTFNSATPILPLPQGVYEKEGKSLPHDPYEQMRLAVSAVFGSWNTTRAVKYR